MGSGEEKPLLLREVEDALPGARDTGSATMGGEDAVFFFRAALRRGLRMSRGYAEKASVMSAAAVQHETHAAGCGVLQNSASPEKGRGEKVVERRAVLCKRGRGLKVGMACRSCVFMS